MWWTPSVPISCCLWFPDRHHHSYIYIGIFLKIIFSFWWKWLYLEIQLSFVWLLYTARLQNSPINIPINIYIWAVFPQRQPALTSGRSLVAGVGWDLGWGLNKTYSLNIHICIFLNVKEIETWSSSTMSLFVCVYVNVLTCLIEL